MNKTMGMWGLWMPGVMQFLTGVILWVGLTWFIAVEVGPEGSAKAGPDKEVDDER